MIAWVHGVPVVFGVPRESLWPLGSYGSSGLLIGMLYSSAMHFFFFQLCAENEITCSHGGECSAFHELKSKYGELKSLKEFRATYKQLNVTLLKVKRGSKKLCEALKWPISIYDHAGRSVELY